MTFNTTLKNNEELPTTKQLKHFLKEAAAQKMPAELVLDSEMLEVQENEEEGGEINDTNEIGEEKEKVASMGGLWQGWLLAVLRTFMLLSIATALLFCAFRNRKHSRQHQTYVRIFGNFFQKFFFQKYCSKLKNLFFIANKTPFFLASP